MSAVWWTVAAYLIGSIPMSYLAARYGAGVDLREQGSKNLGATNLYRVLGAKYAIPVGIFDVLKGLLPVLVFAPLAGSGDWAPLVVGAGAILGHVFPVYLRFQGGKGVATAAGVVVAVAPVPLVVSLVVWCSVLVSTRIMSLASLSGALAFPIAVWLLVPENRPVMIAGASMAVFIIYTHRSNLGRLWHGTEPRLVRRREQEV